MGNYSLLEYLCGKVAPEFFYGEADEFVSRMYLDCANISAIQGAIR